MKKNLILIVIILATGLLFGGIKELKDGVEFSYNAPDAGSVSVAGSFNDWNTTANLLKKTADGTWKTVIALPEGSHTYKYVVDGNWVSDEENPNVAEDGYGGSNSVVEVSTGGIVSKSVHAVKVPSSVNPKVYFDGRYYVLNDMKKGDGSRYSLDKPYHDLNLGIKVKLNQNMEGYTVLNINNTTEGVDMWKTHLNYKRTYMHLDADYLYIYAFDNVGEISFDDPLQIVGGEGYYNYNFGYGYRGVKFLTDNSKIPYMMNLPVDIKLEIFGADQIGDAERDVTAGRLKAGYDFEIAGYESRFNLGSSIYSSRVNNQYNHTFNDSVSFSGDIVDSNPAWEIDAILTSSITQPGWQGSMDYTLGYEHYSFENIKEFRDFGDNELLVKEEHTWQDGAVDHICWKVKFPKALELKGNFQFNEVNLNYEDFPDTVMVLPSPVTNEASLSRSSWSLTASFETDNLNLEAGFKRWQNEYPDSVASWYEYYKFIGRTDGNGKWYQESSELSFAQYMMLGYETGLLWNVKAGYDFWKFSAEYEANIAQIDFNYSPLLVENIVRLNYVISKNWQICTDTRIPMYNSKFLGLVTSFEDDEDVFVANYTALKYHLSDNVWIALSYGINPNVINEVTDQFYNVGRRQYLEDISELDEYLQNTYNGFGDKVRAAEDALAKDDRISLEAVIKF
ncbi:MAG: isoamylase early set domain-containing protein [Candidatus Cloacimonetes bacterium]|nr:isoamylase early set domain-containing protein [Candidatus Cloacimonadota bacterium]